MIVYKANTGELKRWTSTLEGSGKRPLFEGIRGDFLEAYVRHLVLVKDATGFTDESAIQAVAYTTWRGAWDTLDQVPGGPHLFLDYPEESLNSFSLFLDADPDGVKRIYMELVVVYADDETLGYDAVKDILGDRITYGPGGFMAIEDYKVLADAVVLIHQMNSKKKVPAKDTKELERLTTLAIGVVKEADF